MTDSKPQPRQTPSRWRRFSLRTLFAIVTLICVVLGAFSTQVYKQARTVKKLREHGATIDFASPTGSWARSKTFAASVLGQDGAFDIVRISFGDSFKVANGLLVPTKSQFQDVDLKLLCSFRKPWMLNLDGTNVTNDGLKQLEPLGSLHFLYLNRTPISDGDIDQLARLHQLKLLAVVSTQLSDEGMKSLAAKMPWCEIQTAEVTIIESRDSYVPWNNDTTLLADPPVNAQ